MSTSATAVAPVTTTKSFRFNKAPSSRRGSIRIETDGTMTYDPRTRTRWSEVWAARKKDRKALRAGLQPQGRDPHGFLVHACEVVVSLVVFLDVIQAEIVVFALGPAALRGTIAAMPGAARPLARTGILIGSA